jgi:ribonuclease P protein component
LNKSFRFPKTHRLSTKADYDAVFDKPRKLHHKYLTVLFKANHKQHARLGLIVGKRASKFAYDRNKIKRVIRESFRLHQDKLKGFDVVVIAKTSCSKQDKAILREGINALWEKLQRCSPNVLP